MDKIKFTCQACGKTILLQPQVYIAYVGQVTCLDCRAKVKRYEELYARMKKIKEANAKEDLKKTIAIIEEYKAGLISVKNGRRKENERD